MKEQKNKGAVGIISLILWAAMLTIIVNYLAYRGVWDLSGVLFQFLLWGMLCVTAIFFWPLFVSWRINKFAKRVSEASFTYLKTRDVDAYLLEMEACCEMPGVKNAVMSGIAAMDYVTILKIQTLRDAGRVLKRIGITTEEAFKQNAEQVLEQFEKYREAYPGSVRPKPEGDCVPCPDCEGRGIIAKRVLRLDIGKVCKTCGGSGYVPKQH